MSDTQPPVIPANARVIKPTYDARGNPVWKSRMSAPDDTFAMCLMVPDRIIPVIFVPGVMGSNLKGIGQATGTKWLLDSPKTMGPWMTQGAEKRKQTLTPATMEVDDSGHLPVGTQQSPEELKRRGWGEVGAMSYSEFLVWLERSLNDFDDPHDSNGGERVALMWRTLDALVGENKPTKEEVGLSYKYRFPVHAFGYNWLASNKDSAVQLGRRIDAVIARYRADKKRCEKVIIVTHSMGGLVARHCSEVLGYRDKIFGIVHGVMPAIGAAAVYRRFKAGTENSAANKRFEEQMEGWAATLALGRTAAEMTAVLSSAPGPLQLLPTPEYGNGWLKIKDGAKEYSFPQQGDPYAEIYTVRGKWWSMCDDQLVNPLNKEPNPERRQLRINDDWIEFRGLIEKKVRSFHEELKQRYHPLTHAFCGNHADNKAYGTVTWSGDGGSWLRGGRNADVLDGKALDPGEITTERTVAAKLYGPGWLTGEHQVYEVSNPDENGDGTVPQRSGLAPKAFCKSFLQVNVGHEPAYKISAGDDNLRACRFTLRAIVQIAQEVQATSLKYE